MVPSLPSRRLHQRPRSILNRHRLQSINALLQHCHAIQVSDLPRSGALGVAQLLARVAHALVLLHENALALLAQLATEQEPAAVDRPVAQISVAAKPQRRRDALGRQHGKVSQDVDDARVDLLRPSLLLGGAGLLTGEHAGGRTGLALGGVAGGLLLLLRRRLGEEG